MFDWDWLSHRQIRSNFYAVFLWLEDLHPMSPSQWSMGLFHIVPPTSNSVTKCIKYHQITSCRNQLDHGPDYLKKCYEIVIRDENWQPPINIYQYQYQNQHQYQSGWNFGWRPGLQNSNTWLRMMAIRMTGHHTRKRHPKLRMTGHLLDGHPSTDRAYTIILQVFAFCLPLILGI